MTVASIPNVAETSPFAPQTAPLGALPQPAPSSALTALDLRDAAAPLLPGFAYAPADDALRGRAEAGHSRLEDFMGVSTPAREDAPAIREAIEAYRKNDLAAGDLAAAHALDDVARNALRWAALRLQPKAAGYKRIADFIDANPGWPSNGFLQARLEEAMINEKISADRVRARFAGAPPATPTGRFALARALRADRPAESEKLVRTIWREDDFGAWLEGQLQKEFGASATASEVAIKLARAKAMDISLKHPPQIVLGSDQTLEFAGRALAKVESRVEARDRLIQMSGRQHQLHSAFCFARDGEVVHSGVQTATISMRTLSEDFIDVYLDTSGNSVLESVAVYEVEALGIQMIEKIEGDWFTVQGLPLRAVIAFLQHQRLLLS